MKLEKDVLLKGLLQYNYFPRQRRDNEDIPPIFTSEELTPDIASDLIEDSHKRKSGYDQVSYNSTRYNNVSRTLSIPHPLPYVHMADVLAENWGKLDHIAKNDRSIVVPQEHKDGRIIIMDYEGSAQAIKRRIDKSFNKNFYVKTDIAQFFPSIYSHAIPWALVGVDKAKKKQRERKWFNEIDYYQRLLKRQETTGIPIGPGTSNIISEAILAKVDERLKEKFHYYRYIDDYKVFCKTHSEGEKFLRVLSKELSKYELNLNLEKTSINELPIPTDPEWLIDVVNHLPPKNKRGKIKVARFMDYALNKQEQTPDGSVLKYAAKSIKGDLQPDSAKLLLDYLLGLCKNYPILLPLLEALFEKVQPKTENSVYQDKLLNILQEHTTHRRSDAMTWALYYLGKYFQSIPDKFARKVIQSGDCIAILTLYLTNEHDDKVIKFVEELNKADLYQLDQYWILLYELYYDGKMGHPYGFKKAYDERFRGKGSEEDARNREVKTFELLKSKDVSFAENLD